MIVSATVERFRGIRRLEVDGLGRVNLIIGKNDCGKTALMEALLVAEDDEGPSHGARFVQQVRGPKDEADFDRFWRPLFLDQDAEGGLVIDTTDSARGRVRVEMQQGSPLVDVVPEQIARVTPAWTLDIRTMNGVERTSRLHAYGANVVHPPPERRSPGWRAWWWAGAYKSVDRWEIGLFSRLKQAGRDAELLDVSRLIDARVSALELLAPSGTAAELFVRLGQSSPLLPISMMGDGFQRCIQIGVGAVASGLRLLFVDEIENGLHHSTLESVWRWLAQVSSSRDLQIFASTHSDECIQAAARAFTVLGDDGLRVIRLDRREDRTTAAVYTRDLVESAMQADMEIRG